MPRVRDGDDDSIVHGASSVLSPQPASSTSDDQLTTNIRDIPNKQLIIVYFNADH
jgi:hypothetical protein